MSSKTGRRRSARQERQLIAWARLLQAVRQLRDLVEDAYEQDVIDGLARHALVSGVEGLEVDTIDACPR